MVVTYRHGHIVVFFLSSCYEEEEEEEEKEGNEFSFTRTKEHSATATISARPSHITHSLPLRCVALRCAALRNNSPLLFFRDADFFFSTPPPIHLVRVNRFRFFFFSFVVVVDRSTDFNRSSFFRCFIANSMSCFLNLGHVGYY